MKRIALATLAILALAACAPAPPKAPDTAQMIEQAKALDARFIAAFNAGDVDAIMKTYENSPELVSYPPDALEAIGYAAVKDGYAKSFAGMPGGKLELIDPHYRALGDAVLTYGRWKMVMQGSVGAPVEMTGRFTDVKAERNGTWVYLVDHASVPFVAPEPVPTPAPANDAAPPPAKG